MKNSRVTVTKDRVNQVVASVNALVRREVLVGIPEATTSRRQEPITNAALGYIHEFGAPGARVPPRPSLIPGVRRSAPDYVPHLKRAAGAALDGDPKRAEKALVAAGIVAETAVKQLIHSNIPPPLKPATVRGRKYARQTKSRRPGEDRYLGLVSQGVSPAVAQSEAGIVSLINTGQLAAAITSVVRQAK